MALFAALCGAAVSEATERIRTSCRSRRAPHHHQYRQAAGAGEAAAVLGAFPDQRGSPLTERAPFHFRF